MRTIRSTTGPLLERPYFKASEIEAMCTTELRAVGLYPSKPEPIRIERFIEKRFGASPIYENLQEGVLGFSEFGSNGVKQIVISSDLEADSGTPTERRLRTTLAHEAGHGLLHAPLFALGPKAMSLFDDESDVPQILCRDVAGEREVSGTYKGHWWEFQANMVIGGLLMPRRLVEQAVEALVDVVGSFKRPILSEERKGLAIRELSTTFNVNPEVARIRLQQLFLSDTGLQQAL
jgi:hypothetical protein